VRVYVESGDQDHVLLAVLDVDEPARVHVADVAGAQPPPGEHHLGGLVGAIPVAARHLRAADADLADLPELEVPAVVVLDRDLGGWDRQADRAVERRAGWIYAGRGRGLGETPGLREPAASHLFPALRDGCLNH